jgi:hypothetical protein
MQQYPINLPETNAHCEIGPIIKFRPGKVEVWYDSEGENSRMWTKLYFKIATTFRFTPQNAMPAGVVSAYSRIAEQPNSAWLAEIEAITTKRHQKMFPDLRHLVVFFDHCGCLEVIAQNVEISKCVEEPSI